jgi:hypothetical protein
MKSWVRRLRGAVGTGVTWAAAWAAAGIGIGVTTLLPWHPFGPFLRVMDAPLPAMGVPGFFAGMFFSGVLVLAARKRRFKDLSTAKFALWGAVGGALLVVFPFLLVAIGLASAEGSAHTAWAAVAAIAPVFVVLSSASAAGSLMLARRAEERQGAAANLGTGHDEALLGEGDFDLGRPAAREKQRERIPR